MKVRGTISDEIKAARRGSREAEYETMGPGWHCKTKVWKSAKQYDRKQYKCVEIYGWDEINYNYLDE